MTLIALSLNHGYPIVMGDILMTSLEGKNDFETPTFVKGTASVLGTDNQRRPIDLQQKLYVINDRLCIALGGRGDKMFTFLNRIKNLFGTIDFNDDTLHNYLLNYDKEDESGLIALVLRAKKSDAGKIEFTTFFFGDFKGCDNEAFGTVFASGSGANHFLTHASEDIKRKSNTGNNPDGALIRNLSLLGYWLGVETKSAESLANHWGAGYEMIQFRDEKFIKLNEYTVVLFDGKIELDKEFNPIPVNVIFLQYQEEFLIIRAFASGIEKIFVVAPIDTTVKTIEVAPSTQSHITLLVVYALHHPKTDKYFFPAIGLCNYKNQVPDNPIRVSRTKDGLELMVDPRIHDDVYNHHKEMMIVAESNLPDTSFDF